MLKITLGHRPPDEYKKIFLKNKNHLACKRYVLTPEDIVIVEERG
jgi:hypothetical protein